MENIQLFVLLAENRKMFFVLLSSRINFTLILSLTFRIISNAKVMIRIVLFKMYHVLVSYYLSYISSLSNVTNFFADIRCFGLQVLFHFLFYFSCSKNFACQVASIVLFGGLLSIASTLLPFAHLFVI